MVPSTEPAATTEPIAPAATTESPSAPPRRAEPAQAIFKFPSHSKFALPADAKLTELRGDLFTTDKIVVSKESWHVGHIVRFREQLAVITN